MAAAALLAATILLPVVQSQSLESSLPARFEATKSLIQTLKTLGFDTQTLEQTVAGLEDSFKKSSADPAEVVRAVEKINRQFQKVLHTYQQNPKSALKAFDILSRVYALRASASGFSAVLLDVSEQLVEQALNDKSEVHGGELLEKAQTLVESVQGVLAGKPINMKIVRSAESGGEEMEISIASIATTKEVVKVYLTEERFRYSNDTLVVSKNAFINLGNTVIIQKETVRNVKTSSEEKTVLFGENKAIGAVLSLSRVSNKLQLEKTEYDVFVQSHSFEQNHVRLVLSSSQPNAGKIVIIDVDKGFMKNYLPRDIAVRVDGVPAKLAESITELLIENSSEPKYFLAITGRGLQIVLYIPNWSTKVVIIGSASSLSFQIAIPGFWDQRFELIATTAGFILLMSFVLLGKVLRRTLDG
ncbi:MAG: hypothetical protein NZ570_05220 [Candidatus Caldarchaeum sp.]|nr:hypothetical protein [Candidatus Caldarchaeum sp.]MDW7978153.1 hypothetical protein [Candidatus Caldarchaeum sp.]MDW8360096.1 hypothetical protein [Candidatus Caldarchaeum sp.]